ncbi:MAG TPA: ABC transporter permease, partial [Vicinamibacterales bacterium]|nr:ABC transporter permease [Vicinamibacterales bacterium]
MGELTYVIRSLARSRSFAVASVLTLAIGIGAAATIYSVVNTVLFRPLPFPDSDRYVRLIEYTPTPNPARPIVERGLTYTEYLDWRTKPRTLDNITAVIAMSQRMVKTPDGAAGLWGGMTSADTFALMGVRPLLGRTLVAEDAANPDVVVLSHEVWQRHYHGDPGIIGKPLEFRTGALLAPQPMRLLTVVGVMPADFEFPTQRFDFIIPIYLAPGARPPAVTTIARLADGASLPAALDEINTIGSAMREPWPATGPQLEGRRRFELQQLKERVVAPVRPAFRILMATVVVVLLIVCANVANLMLARGSTEQREIAVRLALGARRSQIARQVLTEAAVLATAGGILGSAVAAAGVSLVKQLATVDAPGVFRLMFGASVLPRAHEIAVNGTLLAIVFGISAIACLVFGALPALQLSRTGYQETMGSRGSGAGPAAARLRTGLTVAQLTLATVLLTGAGLLIHSFATLATFDKGYN